MLTESSEQVGFTSSPSNTEVCTPFLFLDHIGHLLYLTFHLQTEENLLNPLQSFVHFDFCKCTEQYDY